MSVILNQDISATRPLVFRYAPNSLNLFYAFDGNKNVSDVFYRLTANGIGAHYDSELGLVYYNYRHYSPTLGRFLSRDPIEEQGGLNLYVFAGNSSLFDCLGLDSVSCESEKDIGNIDFEISHMGFINAKARGNSTVFGRFENLVSQINAWNNLSDLLNIGSDFLTKAQAEFLSNVFSGHAINLGYGGYLDEGLKSAKKGILKIEESLRKQYGLRLDIYFKYKKCECDDGEIDWSSKIKDFEYHCVFSPNNKVYGGEIVDNLPTLAPNFKDPNKINTKNTSECLGQALKLLKSKYGKK